MTIKCPKCKVEPKSYKILDLKLDTISLTCTNCGHMVLYEKVEPSKQSQDEYNRLHTQEFIK